MHPGLKHFVAVVIVAGLGAGVYSNTLGVPFILDDHPNIKDNQLCQLSVLDFGKLYDAAYYSPNRRRPVANVSFALNYYVGQFDVAGYHVLNVFIHVINGILVYFLALATFQLTPWGEKRAGTAHGHWAILCVALCSACIFVAHPLQTQAVTYIVQRMTSLAAMFCFISLLCYICGRTSIESTRRWLFWTASLFSWLFAVETKQNAAIMPLMVFVYEWYFFQDFRFGWLRRHSNFVVAALIVTAIVAFYYLGSQPVERLFGDYVRREFGMLDRVLTQSRVVVFYLSLILFPSPARFNLGHDISISQSIVSPITTLLSIVIIALFLLLGVSIGRKYRLASFCIIWILANLVIESSVIGLEMIFEHRLYMPMLGVALLVAGALFHYLSRTTSRAVIVSMSLIVCLGANTYSRNQTWRTQVSMWSDVLAKSPQSERGYIHRGTALSRDGKYKQAIEDFDRVIQLKRAKTDELKPSAAEPLNNRGLAYAGLEQFESAVQDHTAAIALRPGYTLAYNNRGDAYGKMDQFDFAITDFLTAIQLRPDLPQPYNNLGFTWARLGEHGKAIQWYTKATNVMPDYIEAYENRGRSNGILRNYPEAISDLSIVIAYQPGHKKAIYNRGLAYTYSGNYGPAVDDFSSAIRLQPDWADAYYNRGYVLANKMAQYPPAIGDFTRAIELNPNYVAAYGQRAVAYFNIGQFANARSDAKKVRELGGTPDPDLIKALEKVSGATERR